MSKGPQQEGAKVSKLTPLMVLYYYTLMYSQTQLKHPLHLKWWMRGSDMPFPMTGYVQSVQIQGTLYVGGGYADDNENEHIVMVYDIGAGKWATLPPYRKRWFAMTAIDNHLVLVGGMGRDGDRSKMLGAWSEDSKKWTHPYPDMTTPRSSCSAVVYNQHLVVTGGRGADFVSGRLLSVDVMNIDTKRWRAGPSTPVAWSSMKTAIVGDMCYFMGGYLGIYLGSYTTKVYSVSLQALISQLNFDSSIKDTQTWKELPQLPVTHAAPLSISGFFASSWRAGQD